MSYQLKNSIVSLISTIVLFGIYVYRVLEMYPKEATSEEVLKFWALVIIVAVPVQVIAKIIITIVFNIINSLATNEREPAFTDELDRLIALKAVRNSFYGFLIIFFGGLFTLVFGGDIEQVLIILFAGIIGIGVVGELSEIIYYSRGV